MDARQQRGAQLVAEGKVLYESGTWRVWSQTGAGRRYRVNPVAQTCSCPDHEELGVTCKHVHAVLMVMSAETADDGTTTVETRVTYTQDWSVYNRAQVEEKDFFMSLLN